MGDMISQDEINELLASMPGDETGLENDIIHDFLDDVATYIGYYINDETLSFNYSSINKASLNDIKQFSASEIVSVISELTGLESQPIILFLKQHDAKNIVATINGTDLSEVEDGELTEVDIDSFKSLMDAVVSPIGMLINKFARNIIPQPIKIEQLENSAQIVSKTDIEAEGYYHAEYLLNTSELTNIAFDFYFPADLLVNLEMRIKEEGHQFLDGKVVNKASVGKQGAAPMQNMNQQQMGTQQQYQQPMQNQQMFNGGGMYQQPMQMQYNQMPQNINAQNAEFQQLTYTDVIQQRENIGLIREVPLEVTVEMGRTQKKIREILEFAPGTIIELDKIAGDAIDILANGKFIAKGEVVVIDENYGIRVTEIIGKPEMF